MDHALRHIKWTSPRPSNPATLELHAGSARKQNKRTADGIPTGEVGFSLGNIVEKRKEIDKRRQLAGCFVLLSNLPRENEYSAEQILRTDKEQHAMVTCKFKGVPILCINGQRMLGKPLTET